MSPNDKPLAWLHGEIHTPPFSKAARLEAGSLLRALQRGDKLSMPHPPGAVHRAAVPRTADRR